MPNSRRPCCSGGECQVYGGLSGPSRRDATRCDATPRNGTASLKIDGKALGFSQAKRVAPPGPQAPMPVPLTDGPCHLPSFPLSTRRVSPRCVRRGASSLHSLASSAVVRQRRQPFGRRRVIERRERRERSISDTCLAGTREVPSGDSLRGPGRTLRPTPADRSCSPRRGYERVDRHLPRPDAKATPKRRHGRRAAASRRAGRAWRDRWTGALGVACGGPAPRRRRTAPSSSSTCHPRTTP